MEVCHKAIFNNRAILSLSTLSASSLKCQPLCIVYLFLYSFIRIYFLPSLNILDIAFVYKAFTVGSFLQNCCCCLDLLFNLVIWTITLLTIFMMDTLRIRKLYLFIMQCSWWWAVWLPFRERQIMWGRSISIHSTDSGWSDPPSWKTYCTSGSQSKNYFRFLLFIYCQGSNVKPYAFSWVGLCV